MVLFNRVSLKVKSSNCSVCVRVCNITTILRSIIHVVVVLLRLCLLALAAASILLSTLLFPIWICVFTFQESEQGICYEVVCNATIGCKCQLLLFVLYCCARIWQFIRFLFGVDVYITDWGMCVLLVWFHIFLIYLAFDDFTFCGYLINYSSRIVSFFEAFCAGGCIQLRKRVEGFSWNRRSTDV